MRQARIRIAAGVEGSCPCRWGMMLRGSKAGVVLVVPRVVKQLDEVK
jgi:hypothetical protein